MTSKIQCVIHCRVSTGKQAYEGESLAVQERVCRDIAERNGWHIAHDPWLEAYSGRKHGRQAFADILGFLDRNPGQVRFYVFRAIDRFTRGGVLLYARMKQDLAERGVELVDSMGVIQPSRNTLEHVGFEYEWSRISPSEIAEVVMATTAKAEVNTILTRLIGQEISLTKQGYKIRAPHEGYKNEKVYIEGKRRTILVADPARAPFFVAMFEMRAAGQLSDEEIVERVNAMGYRRPTINRWDANHTRIIGKVGGGPLITKRLQEIIRRPIYCGIVWEKWTDWQPVRAPYPGLVSIETWNAANRGARQVRETSAGLTFRHNFDPSKVGKILNRNNPNFPFKNVILCPTCRKPFMASASRGRSGQRFPAYHCDRGHPRVARSKAAFEEAVRLFVEGLRFAPTASEFAAEAVHALFDEELAKHGEATSSIDRAIADLEAEKANAIRAFTVATSRAVQIALEADVERLDAEIARAADSQAEMEVTQADVQRYLIDVTEILEHPSTLLETPANTRVQIDRYIRIFDELPTIEEIEAGTAKLTHIFSLFRGLSDPKSGLVRQPGLSWNQIKSNIIRHRCALQDAAATHHP